MHNKLRLPSFIVIGAQRAGTTSLHHALSLHPEVFMSKPKELSFFNIDANCERGAEFYSSFFRRWTTEKVAGESTPSYLWDERVPARMAGIVPNARLIALLRNPVDRAYSAYLYAYYNGSEDLPFREALEAEPLRAKEGRAIRGFSSYVDRGLYAFQIKRFLKHYDRSQLLVLIMEEYKQDVEMTLSQVTSFLGVGCESAFLAKAKTVNRNASMVPRSRKVHSYIPFLLQRFHFAGRVVRKLNGMKGKYPPMPSDIRHKLSERFRPSNRELESILGRKLDLWNQ